ncbi:MAG: dehydratase, partial [Dehalococcoidia bacterium]|nr:dehydratase [Dehalococcoidia bacterium]
EQLVKWAGASGDYNQIHYDKDFAMERNLPGVIVHGRLTASMLGQLLTDWMGEEGQLKKFACQFRGMNLPDSDIFLEGKVTRKYREDGHQYVECEVWAENEQGQITAPGTATIILPGRCCN